MASVRVLITIQMMLATGLNTAPIYLIEEKVKQILKPSCTGGLRFQKLHYTYSSNLKDASNDLHLYLHLIHSILRPM